MTAIRNDLDARCPECDGKITLGNVENRKCARCGNSVLEREVCENGHFVCDECRKKAASKTIYEVCLNTNLKDPIAIATQIMNDKNIRMHDLKHHTLVASSLLAAYKNSGYDIDLDKALRDADKRGSWFPAGICGLCGTCGAAASAGIFYSIITNTSPHSTETWSDSNLMTSTTLKKVAEISGPRCCKRNTFISILSACDYVKKKLDVNIEANKNIECQFSERNEECIKGACPFFKAKRCFRS